MNSNFRFGKGGDKWQNGLNGFRDLNEFFLIFLLEMHIF
ncbi:MAG: hypothetical protein RIS64_1111 [Bacteroidota bacterium]|jgi:hypothetical protein